MFHSQAFGGAGCNRRASFAVPGCGFGFERLARFTFLRLTEPRPGTRVCEPQQRSQFGWIDWIRAYCMGYLSAAHSRPRTAGLSYRANSSRRSAATAEELLSFGTPGELEFRLVLPQSLLLSLSLLTLTAPSGILVVGK